MAGPEAEGVVMPEGFCSEGGGVSMQSSGQLLGFSGPSQIESPQRVFPSDGSLSPVVGLGELAELVGEGVEDVQAVNNNAAVINVSLLVNSLPENMTASLLTNQGGSLYCSDITHA